MAFPEDFSQAGSQIPEIGRAFHRAASQDESDPIKTGFLAVLLLAVFLAQGIFLIQETSPTADEIPFHMVNGYAYLKTGDYRMSPANPALLREWMALPWLFIRPKLNLNKQSWAEAESIPFAHDFFYVDNRRLAEKLLYSSRFMILLLGLALGAVIYLWSRSLYGVGGGLLSLALYVFCPNFLAHSSIAHTDVGVSFFSVLAAFFLWRYLEFSRSADFLGTAMALGFACAAKYNALVFGPLFLLIIVLKKGFRVFFRSAACFTVVGFLVVWFSYGFEFKPVLAGAVPRVEEKLAYLPEWLRRPALEIPVPIPSYLLGIAGNLRSHRSPYWHYAFGQWTVSTQWYFYFFSFLIKMTLPFLFLLALRLLLILRTGTKSRNDNLVILAPTAAVFLMTCFDSTAIGVRYLFPVIPLLFVWIGGLARWASGASLKTKALVTAACLQTVSALAAFPSYLSYFNPLASALGGGYRYVRGSDVDWGQGLKALARYMREKDIPTVTLRHFGPADPSFYGIDARPLTQGDIKTPSKKFYAISLFYLEHVAWSKDLKPTAVVGGSIFVYDFRGVGS